LVNKGYCDKMINYIIIVLYPEVLIFII
jgi:hypothetical protein